MKIIKPDKIISGLKEAVITPNINLSPVLGIIISEKASLNEKYYVDRICEYGKIFNTEVIVKKAQNLVQASQFLNEFKRNPYMCGIINISNFGSGNQNLNDMIPSRLDVNCYSSATNGQFIRSLDPTSYRLGPCAAVAAYKVLEYENISLENKKVAILGHSIQVGRPLAEMMCSRNATTTVYPSITEDINLSEYDIVLSSLFEQGQCLTPELWKNNLEKTSYIIDIGTNTNENGETLGNLFLEDFSDYDISIAPLVGCIDQVTLLTLFAKLFKNSAQINGVFYE